MIDFDDIIARKKAGVFHYQDTLRWVIGTHVYKFPFGVVLDPSDPCLDYNEDEGEGTISALLTNGTVWSDKDFNRVYKVIFEAYKCGCLFVNNAIINKATEVYDLRDFTVDELVQLRDSFRKVSLADLKHSVDESVIFSLTGRFVSGHDWARLENKKYLPASMIYVD